MKNWEKHWHTFPDRFDEKSFFEQVGKTVQKKPISRAMFEIILSGIKNNLDIDAHDDILDLCCGNGVITRALSSHCRTLTGIDFSKTLIEIAKKHNKRRNIDYIYGNINELNMLLRNKNFSKAYMYEALQHFDKKQFEKLLANLKYLIKGRFIFFVGSIPDKQKKRDFYNTFRRKLSYMWRVFNNNEAIGHWWDKELIREICCDYSLHVRFINQNRNIYTGHYRFDMLITN